MRTVGTTVRGIRCPIIREGDNLEDIVVEMAESDEPATWHEAWHARRHALSSLGCFSLFLFEKEKEATIKNTRKVFEGVGAFFKKFPHKSLNTN